MLQADPLGVLALIAVMLCWVLAVVLRQVGAPGSVARKLSLLLVFEGITLVTSDCLLFLVKSPAELYARFAWLDTFQHVTHTFGDCGMLALYPPFLAAALHTRLTRPFGTKRVQAGLLVFSVVVFFVAIFTPVEVGLPFLYLSLTLVFGFALWAAIQAWMASTGIARSRAKIFMLAFGFRDICWGIIYAIGIWSIWSEQGHYFGDLEVDLINIIYILGTLVAVPLIAYGILRTQLFDIDLRIRWTIKQSTLAAALVSIMFVLSEGVNQFLSEELGNLPGLLAAALVLFFLAPLQRFADRVASAAMPNTENTPEYAMFRKLQVYESAVGEAQAEGGISQKERTLLVHLRDSLGISAFDAEAIETELQVAPSW